VAVASGSAARNTVSNIVYITKLTNAANQTLSNVAITLTGTYDNNDLGMLTLDVNNVPSLDGNQNTIDFVTPAASGSVTNFSDSIPLLAGTNYLIVSIGINTGADVGHTVIGSKLTLTGLTGTVADTQAATGGTKTIS
jgi:hypothetical protein